MPDEIQGRPMASDAAIRAAKSLFDSGWASVRGDPLGVAAKVRGGKRTRSAAESAVAAIISAEFAREPARLQSREAIERAIGTASDAIVMHYGGSRILSSALIAGDISAQITPQPCGHLLTSQVERDGQQVCEQCELEAEIVEVMREVGAHLGFRLPLVGDSQTESAHRALNALNRMIAKLEWKGPTT